MLDIHSGGRRHILQARFGQFLVRRTAQAECAYGLRQGSFNTGAARVYLSAVLSAQALPGRMQRFVLYLRIQARTTGGGCVWLWWAAPRLNKARARALEINCAFQNLEIRLVAHNSGA